MRKILTILLMFLAAPARAAAPAADFRTVILDAHNQERRIVGVPDLVWDDALAAGAAGWARHLAQLGRLEHSDRDVRGDVGENLWLGTAGAYKPREMVGGWLAEKGDFVPGTFPDVSRTGSWEAIGHYTQLIWRGTAEVGCAMASSPRWDILVCRYAPAGNVLGEPVY